MIWNISLFCTLPFYLVYETNQFYYFILCLFTFCMTWNSFIILYFAFLSCLWNESIALFYTLPHYLVYDMMQFHYSILCLITFSWCEVVSLFYTLPFYLIYDMKQFGYSLLCLFTLSIIWSSFIILYFASLPFHDAK